jgi:pimeloyl-ACP methyl ester carboxylesterase
VTDADDGGHFAALEKPEVLAEHVREAMGVMWKQ